ncbi:type II secretory pathway, ATPase PulE/Tfp pilus assembly pathway, ATPase PilB [Methylophaga aminisulfidivorans MP]|uniref:Type II secretory pathway, ATPase PulE/Tfp pilus assembly pathway, ATPase PilB n=1 Tax=Methylophaga aminisulfidivorans MP TaxID=1026882 RepID=F5T0J7_9GAMM|nr:GspE/PulE family protein [Methylophaga aminisulfidivorans]EGL55353.1 type II secretory pathway, ATPase PulE/Tfp pilus assembly pathway, ATPase PilB [Methylophaga aminisulfidivorans MP]
MNTAYHDITPGKTELVVEALTVEQLNQAKQLAQQSKQPLLKVLEEISELTPDVFVQALGLLVRYPVLTISQLYQLQPDFDVVPFTQAEKIGCLAVRDKHDALYLVHANPFEANLYSKLDLLVNEPATWALAHTEDLNVYLSHHEANMRALGDEVSEHHAERNEDEQAIEDISLRSISEDTSPIVKFVRSTLYDALKAGASDVHLETDQNGLKVKYRIDGVLSHVGGIQGLAQAEQVISRVKVMSDLDIAERRIPQDGRFKVMALGREIDLRVSIMPSVLGEDAVLRVLDRQALSEEAQGLSLEILGFAPDIMARFRLLAEEPYGMLLVTGPTGSGKTTTLYGIISEINHGTDKIITIEDPVEYQLPGVLQIPVNEKKGLTFAKGLRSILRHDPDKIMVGEIRDNETAQIAVQSALTGHLVLTTVHANNVFDVIGRFTNMGVDPYNFVSAMNGILAQRLVRVNCPHCLTEDKPDAALVEKSGLNAEQISDFRFKKGQGCGQCHGLGFKGRKAIAELLCFNDEIRELIVTRQPVRKIKEAAYANGTRTMREAALLLVKNGETTLEEINRVTTLA